MRSSLTLVVALVLLLAGSFDFHADHSLALEPLSGGHEVFEAAAHPYAPLHMEEAGVATYRHSCPACLRLLRSVGMAAPPVAALRMEASGVSMDVVEVHVSQGARFRIGSRGPPVLPA